MFLLGEANVDFVRVRLPWDGGGKPSATPMVGFCGVKSDRGRTCIMDTSSYDGDPCPGFARLCWDGGSDILSTGGLVDNCPCNDGVTSLLEIVAAVAWSSL